MTRTPQLDLAILDTHNIQSIGILDVSSYPPNYNITNPSIQITPPGYETVTLAFTANSAQVYKSSNLKIVCEWCDEVDLPDGIWKFNYSIYPSNDNYVEKSFVKIDRLLAKFDEVYIQLDITECDERVKRADKEFLSIVEDYIAGAVAAGNKCILKRFNTYYKKATEMLNSYINNKSCVK